MYSALDFSVSFNIFHYGGNNLYDRVKCCRLFIQKRMYLLHVVTEGFYLHTGPLMSTNTAQKTVELPNFVTISKAALCGRSQL